MGFFQDKISRYNLPDKIDKSIEALKLASKMSEQYYNKPLLIAYSGGKDSDVMLHLAKRSGIDFEVCHNHTTVDAPQTVYHVRETFSKLNAEGIKTEVIYPLYKGKRISMWDLIVEEKIPPTRIMRYCCRILKENMVENKFIATGVRKEEGTRRAKRNMFEITSNDVKQRISHNMDHVIEVYDDAQNYPEVYDCRYITSLKRNKNASVHPIIEWNAIDVWNYVSDNNIKLCDLYDMGYQRVGCIGCPMAGKRGREREFKDFPKFALNYKKAFERMLKRREECGMPFKGVSTAEEVFNWWMEY